MSIRDHLNDVTNTIVEKFNEHPKKFGLSYREHLFDSMYYGACSMACTIVFVFHAIFPFLFQTTGGNIVTHLQEMINSVQCVTCNDERGDSFCDDKSVNCENDYEKECRNCKDNVTDKGSEDEAEEEEVESSEEEKDQFEEI
jgi:hypothetical protein